MTRLRRLAAGASALATLAILVAGVPASLALGIGWPLPHALPDWAQLRAELTSPIPDAVLIKALACAVWVAWASLAAAVATEAVAAIRGHAARRLPLAGALQPLAAHLVAAVALAAVSATLRPPTGTAAPLGAALLSAAHPPASAAVTARFPERSSPAAANGSSAAALPTAPPAAAASEGSVYVVRRGDTLWGIAAAQLADPLRWREIYALNHGRPQPGGATLADPNDIWPGWTLILPAQAPAPAIPAPANAASPHAAPHEPPAATPTATPPPPTPPGPVQARPAPLPHPTAQREPANSEPVKSQAARAAPGPMVDLPSGSAVAIGLAAAVGAALTAARLQRRRRRRPAKPRPGLTAAEPLAGPTIRRLRRAHLELLDTRQAATAEAVGAPDAAEGPGRPGPAPGCVNAGRTSTTPWTLDLLAHPGIGLAGAGAETAARALGVALAADNGAHRAELLVAGEAASLLDWGRLPGVEVAADLPGALTRLEAELVRRARLLDAHDAGDLRALTASHPEETLGPLVLIAPAPPPAAAQRLAALLSVGQRLGVSAALLGPWPSGLTLSLATDGTIEEASGQGAETLRGARLSTLTAAEADEIAAVLAAAEGAETPEPPATGLPANEAAPEHVPEQPGEQTGTARPVELNVLGAVRVLAAGAELDTGLRTKARELFAYLATRPQGASDEAIVEALWPDAPPGRGAEGFHTALGNLRKLLRDATGLSEAMFVQRSAGRYRIDPDLVQVDLWDFQAHLAQAEHARDDTERTAALAAGGDTYAGELAEGTPYEWAEALREHLRRQAVDALSDLAEARETSGDLPGALTAAEHALAIDPYDEAIYRHVMRLQARHGRPDAAARTYRLLESRLLELDAEPEPITQQLAAELTRQGPRPPRPAKPPSGDARVRGGESPSSASRAPAKPVPYSPHLRESSPGTLYGTPPRGGSISPTVFLAV